MKTQSMEQEPFNPYAAPKAALADAAAPEVQPVFFPVSLPKLALMSLATFGLYEIYWFYKNWKCMQEKFGLKLNAPIRAVFFPLVSYSLFRQIRAHAAEAQLESRVYAGPLALAVFILAALTRLPDPWWMITFLGFLPLLPVQSAVNDINAKFAPGADGNNRFSGWNIAGLLAGAIALALAILGTLVPE
jgi:hypothetical protein